MQISIKSVWCIAFWIFSYHFILFFLVIMYLFPALSEFSTVKFFSKWSDSGDLTTGPSKCEGKTEMNLQRFL